MKKHTFKVSLLASAIGLAATPALATDIRIDGFASIVAGQTLDKDEGPMLNRGYTHRATFNEDSIYGIQFRADLQDGLSATAQFTGKGTEDFEAKINWAYLTYEITDTLSIKAGRQRSPFFLFSDFLDVGYAYHWISPPTEVYDLGVDTIDALNLEHYTELGDWTSRFNMVLGARDFYSDTGGDVKSENSWTLTWSMNRDWLTLRAIYSESRTTTGILDDLASGINQLVGSTLTNEQIDYLDINNDQAVFAGVGASVDFGSWFAASEYTIIEVDDSPRSNDRNSWYVTGGYRINKFTVSLTYATIEDPNNQDTLDLLDTVVEPTLTFLTGGSRGELAAAGAGQILAALPAAYRAGVESESYNLTVRYDFHPSAAFKVDYTQESADYDQGFGTITTMEPSLIRMGVDLVF